MLILAIELTLNDIPFLRHLQMISTASPCGPLQPVSTFFQSSLSRPKMSSYRFQAFSDAPTNPPMYTYTRSLPWMSLNGP